MAVAETLFTLRQLPRLRPLRLELTVVHSNSHLRNLLISTSPKSVVIVEDADCSLDLSNRKKPLLPETDVGGGGGGGGDSDSPAPASMQVPSVSLSGVLNFVDELWSSCVGERLMIFTMNHPERLNPALLRPGRMDRKIHLSYCEPTAFLDAGEELFGGGGQARFDGGGGC